MGLVWGPAVSPSLHSLAVVSQSLWNTTLPFFKAKKKKTSIQQPFYLRLHVCKMWVQLKNIFPTRINLFGYFQGLRRGDVKNILPYKCKDYSQKCVNKNILSLIDYLVNHHAAWKWNPLRRNVCKHCFLASWFPCACNSRAKAKHPVTVQLFIVWQWLRCAVLNLCCVRRTARQKTLWNQIILQGLEGFCFGRCVISRVGHPDLNRICHSRPVSCSLLLISPWLWIIWQ